MIKKIVVDNTLQFKEDMDVQKLVKDVNKKVKLKTFMTKFLVTKVKLYVIIILMVSILVTILYLKNGIMSCQKTMIDEIELSHLCISNIYTPMITIAMGIYKMDSAYLNKISKVTDLDIKCLHFSKLNNNDIFYKNIFSKSLSYK